MKTITNKIFRNWFIHNVIGHPIIQMMGMLFCGHDYTQVASYGIGGMWECKKCGKKEVRELADFY
mgnify:CR=1 FL=1